MNGTSSISFAVEHYNLDLTLDCGQAFRWIRTDQGWEGVVSGRWLCVNCSANAISARTAAPQKDWHWLRDYFQIDLNYRETIQSFPQDLSMQTALQSCMGLRLLRQDPWETLASFICSSTKQIVQIRQIIELLCGRFGKKVASESRREFYSFPGIADIATASESELRQCKMGFRARYLKGTAEQILKDRIDLQDLGKMKVENAREVLMSFPGVGRKIADCVLLFGYGFQQAFPVDVWIMKALQQLYFPKRRKSLKQLQKFSSTYFGPCSGYAQQYLFHYMRVVQKRPTRRGLVHRGSRRVRKL